MRQILPRFAKFAVVGLFAFAVDWMLLALLTERAHLDYLVSSTVSFTVATVLNYLFSMKFVYQHKEELSCRREFTIFVVLAVIGLIINNVCMAVGVEVFNWHYLLVKVLSGAIVALWNFASRMVLIDAG